MARTERFDNKDARPFVEEPQSPDTSAMVDLPDGAVQARERVPKGTYYDELYVSPEDRLEMGMEGAITTEELAHNPDMPGEWVLYSARDHNAPEYRNQQPRIREIRHKFPGAKLAKMPDGENAGHHDAIYVLIPRAEWEAHTQAHDRAAAVFFKGYQTGQIPGTDGTLSEFKQDPDSLEQMKENVHQTLGASGILQNWPKNMTYEDIVRHVGAEAIGQMERQWARNNRSERPDEETRWSDFLKRQTEAARPRRNPNRRYSLPGSPTR